MQGEPSRSSLTSALVLMLILARLNRTQYAIEAMRKNPGGSKGSIINTASFVALMGAATPQLACELVLDVLECRKLLTR